MTETTNVGPVLQVMDDVYQVRLPLPFALNHVNCYLLRGDAGWIILDTGINTPEARRGWQAAFAALDIAAADIDRIVLTHVHPDHYGLAGWLRDWSGASVWLSSREAELAQQIWNQNSLPRALLDFFRWAGVPQDIEQKAGEETQKIRPLTLPHPHQVNCLSPGNLLVTGRRQFEIIHAPGHSDGQLIFYDPADKLLLCGDQVLNKITPNIGLWPVSEPDPLGRYLASLDELSTLDVRLALPGHRSFISRWQARIAQLKAHHAERLTAMLAAVNGTGVTAYEVYSQLFETGRLSMHEVRFAVAETLAHLEYLVRQERLRRDQEKVWLYHRIRT